MAGDATPAGPIAERAYTDLRERIVTLRFPPGSILREDELMAELGIGRTPLREAVQRLARERFVAVRPRRGTYVTGVEADDIVHITEVRAGLESHAARLAARRMTAPTLAAAHELLAALEVAARREDADALMRLDERVHLFVWESSQNPYLVATLEHYFALSLRIWHVVLDRIPGFGHAVHEQAGILRALADRDDDAAGELMREHVLGFQREVLAALADVS